MVKICRTGLLKLNFEIVPKKRIFRFLPKISAGHGWSWKFFFANFQTLGPLGCQGWVVLPQNVKKSQNHCTLLLKSNSASLGQDRTNIHVFAGWREPSRRATLMDEELSTVGTAASFGTASSGTEWRPAAHSGTESRRPADGPSFRLSWRPFSRIFTWIHWGWTTGRGRGRGGGGGCYHRSLSTFTCCQYLNL